MKIGKVFVSDGALLLLSLCFLCDTENTLPAFLLAGLLHEFGHLLVLCWSGGQLQTVQLCGCGAVIHCKMPASTWKRVLICAAGPIASFALYAIAYVLGVSLLAGASLLLGLFNLMPIPPLDGGMILQHAFGTMHANALRIVAFVASGVLLMAGIVLAVNGFGIWLLIISVSVLLQATKGLANCDKFVYNSLGHTI